MSAEQAAREVEGSLLDKSATFVSTREGTYTMP